MQPGLGMFITRDPADGDDLRPESMNGWNYVENDPINAPDPSGLCSPTWCKPNTVAWVQNSGGLALRGWASLKADPPIQRMADGTAVWVGSAAIFADNIVWRYVTLANQRSVSGFAAEWDSGTDYLTDKEPQPPQPSPGPGPNPLPGPDQQWVSPFGQGSGFVKGYRFTWNGTAGHNGIDLVSNNDPHVIAGEVVCSTAGCHYTGNATCETYDNYQDVDGRKVVAVASGQIEWVSSAQAPTGNPDVDQNYGILQLKYSKDNEIYQIQYVHVHAAAGIVSNKQVNAGDTLGWYGPYGTFGEFLHLHLGLKQNADSKDPEPYLP